MDIPSILALASAGSNAVSGVATAFKSVRESVATNPDVPEEVRDKLSVLLDQIIEAKQLNLTLVERIEELAKELRKSDEFRIELSRYQMIETRNGAIVWALSASESQGQPMHYICPNCAHEKRISILQGYRYYRRCPRCHTGFSFMDQPAIGAGDYEPY